MLDLLERISITGSLAGRAMPLYLSLLASGYRAISLLLGQTVAGVSTHGHPMPDNDAALKWIPSAL